MPSSTFFTTNPHWQWWIILYFFFGGIAAGSYVIATLVDLCGAPEDEPLARMGYYVAFVALLPCPLLLIVDLNRPERFWHMLIQSETGWPMLKHWSPMSVGSWALLMFGVCTLLSCLHALARGGRIHWGLARAVHRAMSHRRIHGLFALLGSAFGFFVASYTGVLLAVTNRPIWADTPLLGLLFLTSAASTAAALLLLLGQRWRSVSGASLHRLGRMEAWVTLLELVVVSAMLLSLGPVMRVWLGAWGLGLMLIVVLGMVVPLALHWRPRWLGGMSVPTAAGLALASGLLLRVVIVLQSEAL
jgi:formate-dependent nitrite reductase membrane component NrfD